MSEQSQARTRREIEAHIIAQAWKDNAYKQELLNNSKTVIEQEFGVQIPDDIKVNVLEENPTTLYFVLPVRPEISGQELSDEQLEAIAGGTTPYEALKSALSFLASLITIATRPN
ncbi:NHLP leader peptide family RiPP precursor [Aetokthonos hydrillicola Thurmond2011]|jgi:hypothetical protein|uniref:NHLP leader peptide family RiPP n=1 Tax=Aetokthonos hydrillicola Thurmond2011 TaxID=2712845 RepID=A0AAP5I8N2_9CYAN|nr:NHLP leader peptide family RiPP precursor [Aetokthonos hydrillicola]MBO3458657.1 NHLP leader peptide family natural product precursor [Aetokthonos hydrillicola CCALA 1050]MBW4588010.1 NHLP leader peptide family RiPP precursor [Aetokthonos hydrillicola CCALA 1050]MDR9897038.1 NHLP leader peptide family RiPP precursor [Aetokthonos hydrillicola Thurmond2011]